MLWRRDKRPSAGQAQILQRRPRLECVRGDARSLLTRTTSSGARPLRCSTAPPIGRLAPVIRAVSVITAVADFMAREADGFCALAALEPCSKTFNELIPLTSHLMNR